MATEIMKSFGALQQELEKAKENLKGVDENIKRLTGRDPTEGPVRPGVKRPGSQPEEFRGRGRGFTPGRRRDPGGRPEEEGPASKKRNREGGAPPRVAGSKVKKSGDSGDEEELQNKPAVPSRVIATPKDTKSRQEVMAAQNADERSKARNRRMFGALLGTLQKFRQEETRMKEREEKRAKVEKKVEEAAKREKEELKKERQELFTERKRKQAEIRKIELKMIRMKEQDEWEAIHRHLMNFIQTRTKPPIFFLPKTHNTKTEERLVASQKVVARMIEKKRQDLQAELEAIEKRGRWRQGFEGAEGGVEESEEEQEGEEGQEELGEGEIGDKENRPDIVGDLEQGVVVKIEKESEGGAGTGKDMGEGEGVQCLTTSYSEIPADQPCSNEQQVSISNLEDVPLPAGEAKPKDSCETFNTDNSNNNNNNSNNNNNNNGSICINEGEPSMGEFPNPVDEKEFEPVYD